MKYFYFSNQNTYPYKMCVLEYTIYKLSAKHVLMQGWNLYCEVKLRIETCYHFVYNETIPLTSNTMYLTCHDMYVHHELTFLVYKWKRNMWNRCEPHVNKKSEEQAVHLDGCITKHEISCAGHSTDWLCHYSGRIFYHTASVYHEQPAYVESLYKTSPAAMVLNVHSGKYLLYPTVTILTRCEV